MAVSEVGNVFYIQFKQTSFFKW